MVVENDCRQSSQRIAWIFPFIEQLIMQVKFSSSAGKSGAFR
jgi:hypothetical protein